MRTSIRDRLRHILNPLHVYCSLSYVMRRKAALGAARTYEQKIYTPLFRSFL